MKLSIKKPLPIGIDKFDKLIDGGYYYLGRLINNERLFDGLAIMEQGEKYTKHFGKYPVISLSLKSAKQPEFEMAYLSIVEEISNEFERHKEVLENKDILESDKEKYKAIMERRADKIFYAKSIAFLSKVLAIHYQKNVIILIDVNSKSYPKPYWSNTSSNSIIRSLIEKADMKTKSEIQELIDGNAIEKVVFEEVTYEDINKKDDNLWSFLLFTGYLKKVSKRQEGENIYVKMAIPNSEVRYIYKNMIIEWFNNKIKQKDFSKMYEGMFKGDEITFEEELVSVLEETISFNDAYENFYHGFLVGVLSNIDNYEIKSNRESGIGRSDIIIKYPNRRGKAVIIEIKVSQNVNDLENKCYEALNQIEEKKYDMELVQDGYKDILKYGIAFYKKDCMIKCKNHL